MNVKVSLTFDFSQRADSAVIKLSRLKTLVTQGDWNARMCQILALLGMGCVFKVMVVVVISCAASQFDRRMRNYIKEYWVVTVKCVGGREF